MIDVEQYIFNALYDTMAPLCAENAFKSVPTPNPTVFPTVTLFEMDNRTDTTRNSNSGHEDFAVLTYQAHVYATSKQKCREVYKALDEALTGMNMTRLSGTFSPNLGNTKVYEYVARYRVRVADDGCLFRAG